MRNFLLILFGFSFGFLQAQVVSDAYFEQKQNRIYLHYTLNNETPESRFFVEALCSSDGGKTFDIPMTGIFGDAGSGISGHGSKTIIWDVLADRNNLSGNNFVFKIEAKVETEKNPKKSYIDKNNTHLIFVKGEMFTLGSPENEQGRFNDERQHTVFVSDFYLTETETTNAQFCNFLNQTQNIKCDSENALWLDEKRIIQLPENGKIEKHKGKYQTETGYENHPVNMVTWYGAQAYCNWLSEQTCNYFRLPTEAEWEFVAKSGNSAERWAGTSDAKNLREFANFGGTGCKSTASLKPNKAGFYDLSGNLAEWCYDKYASDYGAGNRETANPSGAETGTLRLVRGGSFLSNKNECRTSFRNSRNPEFGAEDLGFRVCRTNN